MTTPLNRRTVLAAGAAALGATVPLATATQGAAAMADRKPSVLIVGAGTFGLSTAYHLLERGYTDITVLDRYPAPSRGSAGYDISSSPCPALRCARRRAHERGARR